MRKLFYLVLILFLTTKLHPQGLQSVSFTDSNHGTAVGGCIILRTTDGGKHWINQPIDTTIALSNVCFTDSITGTAVGIDWRFGGGGVILRTKDGGNNWINKSNADSISYNAVSFIDTNNGTVVGRWGDWSTYQSVILRTTDGGDNWTPQYSGNEFLPAVSFTDSNNGMAVGYTWDFVKTEGIVLRTTNGGTDWTRQSIATFGLTDVCFTDKYNGTVVGGVGKILRTTDGGNKWIDKSPGTTCIVQAVCFTDANNGTVVGFDNGSGIILRTTDGGNSWVSKSVGTIYLYDVSFTDVNNGTAVGYNWNSNLPVILRTIDGGEKWIDQLSLQSDTGMVTISGSVKYENNEPAQFIYVQLYGVDSSKTYYTYTDASGNYSVQVDKDFYYIAAKISYNAGCVMTYRLKYYDNKSSLSEADLVEVNNNISDIDFTFPALIQGTISGTVRDAITKQPLSNTVIEFYTAEVLSDSNVVYTDQNGNYTVGVFEGNYILNAFRFFGYYYRQYYKEAYNPFDATPIIVNQDNLNVTGIDFYLTSPQPGSNIIHGYVRDEATYSLPNVEVYAIPLSGGKWIEAKTNLFGEYFLRDIVNGQYILLFHKEGFVSEFYNDAYEWEKAFVFNLIGNQNITANVYLDSLNSFGGEITGNVSANAGNYLSSTLLSAVNSSGKVVSSALSGFNGNYLIPSLVNGNYKIKASKIGYASCEYSGEIQIDLINNPVADGVNISISTTGVETDENKIPESFELLQNYPNPFNPGTTISWQSPVSSLPDGKAGRQVLKVFDVLGNEIKTLVNEEKEAGYHSVDFNASELPSGVYFYQLKAGNFVDVKKMVLLR